MLGVRGMRLGYISSGRPFILGGHNFHVSYWNGRQISFKLHHQQSANHDDICLLIH